MSRYTVDWNPGVRDFLERIGALPEVIEFIESQDDPKVQGKLANEVRKHPGITLDQIEQVAGAQSKKREPNNNELNLLIALDVLRREGVPVDWVFSDFGEWAIVQLMKHRHQPKQTIESFLDAAGHIHDIEETESLFREIRDWHQSWPQNTRRRLASFNLEQAIQASAEWHRAVAGIGTGLVYDGTGEVVHEWDDGWTVQTVTTPNDLTVEGNRMQHCSATYADKVAEGRCRIFSLRDPNNMPHATIELKGQEDTIVQIQGKQDKKPVKEYRKRVGEWLTDIGVVMIHNTGYGEKSITYRVWEQYDIKDAAYAVGDYYGQKDQDPVGEDEDYGIPMIEEIEWDNPSSVLEAVIDKYDQDFKYAHDPKNSHAAYHLRRIEGLDDEFVENLSSQLVYQCEKGELDEKITQESVDFRKKALFEEAAKLYYGLYQVDDETGYWVDADRADEYIFNRGLRYPDGTPVDSGDLGSYGQLPEDYLIWANQQVRSDPIIRLCREILEKLGYQVFPADTIVKDAPGQRMLFEERDEV